MPAPQGFDYHERKNGEVAITHHGRPAVVLRRGAAVRFLRVDKDVDPQEVMARATGNYKRGNERGRSLAGCVSRYSLVRRRGLSGPW